MSRCKLGTKVVDMNRRGFLGMIIGGLATAAAMRTFPFRVFSFPTEIIAPSRLSVYQITNLSLEAIADQIPDLIERDAELYKMFLGVRYGEYYDPKPSLNAFPNSFRRFYPDESLGKLPLGSAPPK